MSTSAIPAWRDQIAQLRYLAAMVARVHGPTHPAMATLCQVVAALADSNLGDQAAHAALGRRLGELTGDFHPWNGACGSAPPVFSRAAVGRVARRVARRTTHRRLAR